ALGHPGRVGEAAEAVAGRDHLRDTVARAVADVAVRDLAVRLASGRCAGQPRYGVDAGTGAVALPAAVRPALAVVARIHRGGHGHAGPRRVRAGQALPGALALAAEL